MTATLADERSATYYPEDTEASLYIGTWEILTLGSGRGNPCGPAHVGVNGEHYRYEQYQAHTLWGLRKMNRREVVSWRIKKALGRPV